MSKLDSDRWRGGEYVALFVTMAVLVPVMSIIERVTEAPSWVGIVVYATLTLLTHLAIHPGMNVTVGAVLFAALLMFALGTIQATADALDVWFGWVGAAVLAPVYAVQWQRNRRKRQREQERDQAITRIAAERDDLMNRLRDS